MLALFSGGATASGGFDLDDPVTITSDDGTVEYVAVFGDSVVTWTGFDTPAQFFDITITLEESGGAFGEQEIHSTGLVDLDNDDWGNYDESLSGSGTSGTIESGIGLDESGSHDPTIDWHIVGTDPDGYGLPENPVDASHLAVDEDGATTSYTLVMRSTYTWYDASETELFSETFASTIPVDVTNEEAGAGVSDGDGDDGAVGA